MTDSPIWKRLGWRPALAIVAVLSLAIAVTLWMMGRVLYCKCGYVELWHGDVFSSGNSQHVSDWYSPSHVIHGFIFYAILRFVLPGWTPAARLVVAVLIEGAWEIFENTEMVINRYREATIALDYYGDSVLNSVFDILAMVAGFALAARLPVWSIVAAALVLEVFVGYAIRDNLTLNIIMLLWPSETIKQWQMGG